MSPELIDWTDDPLSSDDNAKAVYLSEMQNNSNFVQEYAEKGLSSWKGATIGESFYKQHIDELKVALEDPALLRFYGFNSIYHAIGRYWSNYPTSGGIPLGGFDIMNDVRDVVDAMVGTITPEAYLITTPYDASRGEAFDAEIQAYDSETGEFATSYVPEGNVGIWLTDTDGNFIDESIAPSLTDGSGWSAGAKTVNVTITGGSGTTLVRLWCRDHKTLRKGYADVAVDADTTFDLTPSLHRHIRGFEAVGGITSAVWSSTWINARNGVGALEHPILPEDGFLRQWQETAYGETTAADIRRSYYEVDVSAYKGTTVSARLKLTSAFEALAFGAVPTSDLNDERFAYALYTSEDALTGSTDFERFVNLLALAQAGTRQSVSTFHTMKWMDDTYNEIWFEISANAINNAPGDYLYIALIGWEDYWNQPWPWPGDIHARYDAPQATFLGTPKLEIATA